MNVTQIFLASTPYGAATLAAGVDAGVFPPAGRRILLTSNHSVTPEITPGLTAMPGFDALRRRFDEVRDWNAFIAPQHPGTWTPRTEDVPLWERQLRASWGLGEDRVELVVESLQVPPAQGLCQVFPGAAVDVYADGLMSYGPTRVRLDPRIGMRVRRVLHLDLVPGLEPLLLTEFGVPAEPVPAADFLKVLAELTSYGEPPAHVGESPAVLLGQYLAALELLSAAEEEDLHVEMVRGAYARGHRELVFKPHPSAPAAYSRRAEEEARRLGARLTVITEPVLAETLYERLRPALVVGCFSTGLLTASTLYGIPVARTGTGAMLERLTPYENSNRIPLVLVDALLPDLAGSGEPPRAVDLPALVAAVGFTMQPRVLAERRADVERFLAAHPTADTARYFRRRRLTALALPGGVPARLSFLPRNRLVRRAGRRLLRRFPVLRRLR
ncbi:alpha-2,8-polysialyltransferase family protein [Streptomyces sp. NBC_00513]|uniref:polysialyltransferase family glycosyltransferase n=1 Tax=unclassified Streptomyces TaxID=2593676 RepID=UPI00225ABB0C|nr:MULTISPECIES: polysialyltransferase family glycosyltransferase [unclassified Streptomyces]MCX5073746.1 alpha-2,8-polysialyltransferase family protein [Streptomyces sp. NBC_00424]MCX5154702.1 alpha-2,8-polysialyltransferase family protein [Streptomyces sp. NBC_00291]WUD43027.1 alpha-2,8-polysialyltransferase family protein [Streptomyces sp. NBC_00513]